MRKHLLIFLLFFALNTVLPALNKWNTLKNDFFTVFYSSGQIDMALEVLRILEYYRPHVEQLTGGKALNLPIVLDDMGIYTNGFADPVFRRIHLFTYPPSTGEICFTPNWWSLVGVHEYIHILHLTSNSGIPGLLCKLCGNIFSPNIFAPTWVIEGIAVYGESRISEYGGRLNQGAFDAYIGSLATDASLPSIVQATFNDASFPGGGGAYLYGAEFYRFLAVQYGEEAFSRFFKDYGASGLAYISPLIPGFGIDLSAKEVFGKSFPALWKEWQEYELKRFSSYEQAGKAVTSTKASNRSNRWKVENPVIWEDSLIFQRAFPEDISPLHRSWVYQLVKRDLCTGKEKVLVSLPSPFTGPLRIKDHRLYFAALQVKAGFANAHNNSYGYTADLYEYDLLRGRKRKVHTDQIRSFAVLPGGDILYTKDREDAFGSNVYCIIRGERTHKLLCTSDYLVGDILAGRDRIFISARKDWQNFSIYTLDYTEEQLQMNNSDEFLLEPLVKTDFFEGNLSLYGEKLFFSANYGGSVSAYCCDLSTRQFYNVSPEGYASYPAFDSERGDLYFVGLNAGGYDIYREKVVFSEIQIPGFSDIEPPRTALPEECIRHGGYWDNLKTLWPRMFLPVILFGNDLTEISAGAGILGVTALGDFQYDLFVLYDFFENKPELDIALSTNLLSPIVCSAGFTTIDQNSLTVSLELPVYKSLRPGLSVLSLGIEGELFEDDFSRKKIEPYLGFSFRAPLFGLSGVLGLPFERIEMGSTLNRIGLLMNLSVSQYILIGNICMDMIGVYDFDGSGWLLPVIRGYDEGMDAEKGFISSLDYPVRLFKIRQGLWNPALFFEDLFINPFFDFTMNESGEYRFSGGAEIHLELKALAIASGVPLDLFAGMAVNRDKKLSIIAGVKSSVSELLIRKRVRRK